MPRKLTQAEFLNRAKQVHGDQYDYSQAVYKNMSTKVKIICPKHGPFMQTPNNHLSGKGCPVCGGHQLMTQEQFIKKAKRVHGDRYDYSKVKYVNSKTKVTIICPIHGPFEQEANSHLQGFRCPKCYNEFERGKNFDVEARQEKIKATWKSLYGVDNVMKDAGVAKRNRDKKLTNGTFERSALEDKLYDRLVAQFGKDDVKRQYEDPERYPFRCDFYVQSRDLFIELNAHWSHGNCWMNPDEVDDKQRGKNGRIYDTLRRAYAMAYDLNYVVFWASDGGDIDLWFMMDCPNGCDWQMEYSWLPFMRSGLTLPIKRLTKSTGFQISRLAKATQQDVFYKKEKSLYRQRSLQVGQKHSIAVRLLLNRVKYLDKKPQDLTVQEILSGFKISGLHRSYSGFDNRLMVEVLNDYGPSSIFDPFAGWGERAMTAHAMGIDYYGIDINPELQVGYQKQMELGCLTKEDVPAIGDARMITLPGQMVLTCPPYGDLEQYTPFGMDACKTESEFLADWRRVVMLNSDKEYFAFQIDEAHQEAMSKVLIKAGYQLDRCYTMGYQHVSHFNRLHHPKKNGEIMLVFKKRTWMNI